MKQLFLFAIICCLAVGTIACPQTPLFNAKSGSIVIVLDGKVAFEFDTEDCDFSRDENVLAIYNERGKEVFRKGFAGNHLASELQLEPGIFTAKLLNTDCIDKVSFQVK